MLVALNELSTQQSAPTQDTLSKCHRLLNYAATYPTATIRYHASDMILTVDTDAAYLVFPKARSRVAGYFYLSNITPDRTSTPMPNGFILVECHGLRNVVSSAAEAETGGTFHNAQKAIPLLETVFEHPQPAAGTPITTDNLTSHGTLTNFVKPKKSKTWDMRYHWLEDRIAQKQIQCPFV